MEVQIPKVSISKMPFRNFKNLPEFLHLGLGICFKQKSSKNNRKRPKTTGIPNFPNQNTESLSRRKKPKPTFHPLDNLNQHLLLTLHTCAIQKTSRIARQLTKGVVPSPQQGRLREIEQAQALALKSHAAPQPRASLPSTTFPRRQHILVAHQSRSFFTISQLFAPHCV